MNNVSLTGRLTREPELRYGGQDNSTAITRFTLAVDDGKDTDFINIKCFGRTAEWAQKWLSKGSRAEVTGKIKTGSYESQRTGSKVYYTEVVANSVGFGESKAEAEARGQQLPESDGFMNIQEGADEELPKTNRKNAGFTDEEREKFTRLLDAGFIDTWRYFNPDLEGVYSWWSYRFSARQKNAGWRIDYFCVSDSLKDRLVSAAIHTDVMGSDHCPVEVVIGD